MNAKKKKGFKTTAPRAKVIETRSGPSSNKKGSVERSGQDEGSPRGGILLKKGETRKDGDSSSTKRVLRAQVGTGIGDVRNHRGKNAEEKAGNGFWGERSTSNL